MNYKIETHLHTKESSSCSEIRAVEMVRLYKEKGYSTVIVTDHYSKNKFNRLNVDNWNEIIDYLVNGYKMAKEEGDKLRTNILFGIELTLNINNSDYLVYGITEKYLRDNPELYNLTVQELSELCKKNKFLLVQAHPFRDNIEIAAIDLIDKIEVYNGCQNEVSRNDKAYEYAIQNRMDMLSGSDFHSIDDLARGGIVVNKEIKTIEDYIYCINNKEYSTIKNGEYM